ncbi:sensor histidine kinase [Aequorivita lipolytica]|uniref:histidine kinase n=1 Tax=Aequorivita lipolytica TaxID=153267 RepID=A0A5C6YP19_9FLAO|nr:HAMP domain-containing sensor histidine kinase [Aequorivita lipolytica]TXD68967.1 HAMP domain-containing histidine kinase [Aequorivita lipolytica]SRX53042.1 Sensor protein ZraS [Aequorivita lipolytica]
MNYKGYRFSLSLRVLGLLISLTVLAFGIVLPNTYAIITGIFLSIFAVYHLYNFAIKRFVAMDDFFESVKYRDFSRWFSEEHGPTDMTELHKGFNLVNRTIKSIDNEREAQFLYLQKILEMVNIGIIAYNVESGEVLWANDSILKTLDFPSFKNISFVEKRHPQLYDELFETYHSTTASVPLEMKQETLNVLISDTVFEMETNSFKLIVLQNIEETLSQNESEAWKKLLSVMTHEIMNSIAPISSLAETLENEIQNNLNDPEANLLNIEDLNSGIKSIKRRSEGLLKFAKTYRSLNKVTQLNLANVRIEELFNNIQTLMQPSIENNNIKIEFLLENPDLQINIDSYLIEQVLINLLLNSIEACHQVENAKIQLAAHKKTNGNVIIRVSDNGKGIPEEIKDSVFVPFFSTKKTGSGIGLSLSKQIMLLHKGRIQIKSREGEGTIISLMF